MLVIGDSLADWLAYGLEEALTDTPEIGVVRKIKGRAGLVRYEARNDATDWSQAVKEMLASEQPNAVVVMLGLNDRQSLRERAAHQSGRSATAMKRRRPPRPPSRPNQTPRRRHRAGEAPPAPRRQIGPNSPAAVAEAPARPCAGRNYEFHTDKWTELYGKRVDEMMAVAQGQGRAGVVGRLARASRYALDQRYELPR